MKKLTLLPVFLFIILFISCNKTKEEKLPDDSSFYALKDDSDWITTSNWTTYSKNTGEIIVTGVKRDSVYYQEEWLQFQFKLSEIADSEELTPFTSKWYYIIGGDAISNSFVMDTTFQNQLTITEFDTDNKQISGTFQVKLMGDNRYSSQDETMLYKNGAFNISYTEVE